MAQSRAPRVSFVSLGCPKALVDSERIITRLRAEGYELTREHAGADLAIVNTCGFLDSAQAESLAAIGAALSRERQGDRHRLHGRRAREDHRALSRACSPSPGRSNTKAWSRRSIRWRRRSTIRFSTWCRREGIKLTPRHYAYLKISEGCNNRCTFCIIPRLRGDLVSRPAADVLGEAERLVAAGVKELLVISQDTSAYGIDLKYAASSWKGRQVQAKFIALARALGELGVWVRLHYVYPYPHVDEVIALMADGKALPYLDVPFQHASPDVLKRMKRPAAQEETLERIRALARHLPRSHHPLDLHRRLPGRDRGGLPVPARLAERSRARSRRLLPLRAGQGRDRQRSRRAGAGEVKEERWHRLMAHQQTISTRRLKRKLGTRQQVIIDAVGPTVAKGRSKGDAPEIDGAVYVKSHRPLRVGEIATVKIERTDDYDLHGTAVGF